MFVGVTLWKRENPESHGYPESHGLPEKAGSQAKWNPKSKRGVRLVKARWLGCVGGLSWGLWNVFLLRGIGKTVIRGLSEALEGSKWSQGYPTVQKRQACAHV